MDGCELAQGLLHITMQRKPTDVSWRSTPACTQATSGRVRAKYITIPSTAPKYTCSAYLFNSCLAVKVSHDACIHAALSFVARFGTSRLPCLLTLLTVPCPRHIATTSGCYRGTPRSEVISHHVLAAVLWVIPLCGQFLANEGSDLASSSRPEGF